MLSLALGTSIETSLLTVDDKTGLMWVTDGNLAKKAMTWKEAVEYCKKLDYAGFSDWRLPTVEELSSIVDYTKHDPTIDEEKFRNTQCESYWSSTPYAAYTTYAWLVEFGGGRVSSDPKSYSYYVRAVRGGL